jgi:subtilisin family serine protease
MKRLFLASLGLAAIAAVGLCLWWMAQHEPRQVSTRSSEVVMTSSAMNAQLRRTGTGRQIEDRFTDKVVLDERESVVKLETGETQVRRVRLVRDESLKYPLVRVEDEFIRSSKGDRLVRQNAMVGDHVMVKLRNPKMTEAELLALLGDGAATVRRRMPASGLWLVAFSEPKVDTVPRAITKMSKLKDHILVVEPDHVMSVQATPNDTSFSTLWGLHNTGQSGGTADADIDAPEAWELSTGSQDVVVAVIDSGIDQTHPDLVANLWTNPGEIAGNGIDDDNNGYVDDTRGWDWVNSDNNPNDDNGHGTHCAGTIGAIGNNGTGVSGVCWQVSLLGLKFLNSAGNGFESDGAEAIAYATDLGVTLTSNSYTGTSYTQSMKDVIDEAHEAGILFVAAAGNNASNIDLSPEYPAAYDSPNILSVTATTRTDGLASFSNFAAAAVDLAAPGNEIYSTIHNGGYGLKNGTSMAAPHVAGACALLKSYKPEMTHMEMRELILSTVNPLPALAGKCSSGGRLNLYNAMLASDDILATPTGGLRASGPIGGPFTPTAQTITLTNHGTTSLPWTADVSGSWLTLSTTSGSLGAGASTEITVEINAAADQLLATTHTGLVTITSTSSGRVQARTVSLEVSAAPVFSTNLDTDPGWGRTGEWAYGTPLGQGAVSFGNPDPSAGSTGTQVFGINLAGDYAVNNNAPQHLTAGPFDLTGKHGTKLSFQRWLNADYQPWVVTSIELSTDGSHWNMIWENDINTPRDDEWTQVEHDLSSIADGHAQVYVRWGHTVTSSDAYPQSGWNLDDIVIHAVPDRQLRLLIPAELTEGGVTGTATVMVAPAPAGDLVISLASSRPGEEASFPLTVTILSGQTETHFTVTPINDSRIDGTQSVNLTASAVNWPSSSAVLQVHDDETTTLSLSLPASVSEGSPDLLNVAVVSIPDAAPVAVEVALSSNDTSELVVPPSVVIPQGQTQAFFTLAMPEDALIDGAQSVTITASVIHWTPASASLQVFDNEATQLSVFLTSPTLESAGVVVGGGVVSVPGTLVNALTVTLGSSDTSELIVPMSVQIAAGSSEAAFDLNLVNDALVDGDQSVTVTATASGFTAGSAVMIVSDDEQPALPVNPSPAHLNSPTHPDTDLAWSFDAVSGGIPESYAVLFGTLPLPAELVGNVEAPLLALPRLEPGVTYYWQIISHRGGQSRSGPVWSFTVPPVGSAHHFGWSDVPAAAARGTAFTSRVTAYDEWDNEIGDFAGPVTLSAHAQAEPTTTGAGTFAWHYPLASYYHDARMQSIYTPSEVGGSGSLTSLALDVAKLPGQLLKDFTIRLKHTSRASYPFNDRTWESDGWITVFSGNVTLSSLGWSSLSFTTPFDYDGTLNLMVDVSFNNNDYTSDGTVRSTITTLNRTLSFRTDSAYGDPLTWSGTMPQGTASNTLPNLRFGRTASALAMSPGSSGNFVHGSWSGSVTVQTPAAAAWLKAALPAAPTIMGASSLLDIVAVNDLVLAAEPLFTGGTSNTISWTALGSGYEYELQRATSSNFSDAISTGFITAAQQSFTSLTDGQLYHYRARARASGLTGAWSEPQRSTQDATPPALTLTPGTGGLVLADHLMLLGNGTDMSGVASVTVNGAGVTTADAFATWTQNLASLANGLNAFTIAASDNAVPPNTRTETWSILRLADPEADADANGISALFDYAFHAGEIGLAALPQTSSQEDPGTGNRHLTFSYRRLLSNPSGVQYHLETSTTLAAWEPAGANAEELSVIPTGDGITETVTARLLPAMNAGVPMFIRVRVEVP